jgi:predicted N-acetyltransferase YhbS
MKIRTATSAEVADLARLINDAFVVEAFFKIGDRVSADEISELMQGGSEFLVLDNEEPGTGTGTLLGCVCLKCTGDHGYLGMLSVHPSRQHQGLGRMLIDAVETRARELRCRVMDMHIVNLREELPAYYRRLGYVESGTLPFSEPERSTQPCFFIVMSKPL